MGNHDHVQMWTGSRAAALDWGHCRPAPGHVAQGCRHVPAVGMTDLFRHVQTGRRFGVGTFYCRSRAGLTAGFVTRFAGTRGDIDRRLILVRSGSSSPAAWPGRRSVSLVRFAASRRHIDFQPLDQACQHNSNRLPRHLSVSVSRVSLRPERSDTRRPKSWKLQPPARTT